MKHIPVALNSASIAEAVKRLTAYRDRIPAKVNELARRLAEMGAGKVFIGFQNAAYDGDASFSVNVEEIAGGYSVVVTGAAAVFMEFGTGVRYGSGYPGAVPAGISPIGTYGKGHGSQPYGWWFTDLSGESTHTYGNPPAAVMYKTAQELKAAIVSVAKEVFASA